MDGNSGSGFMDGIQSMGIVNAMKTGNMHLDMIIAMCIPIFLRIMFSIVSSISLERMYEQVVQFFTREDDSAHHHTRIIEHVEEKAEHNTQFASLDGQSKNEILIKAITMYLQHLKCMKLQHSDLKLTTLNGQESDYCYDSDDDSDSEEAGRLSNQLLTYRIVQNPSDDEWHPTGRKYPNLKPVVAATPYEGVVVEAAAARTDGADDRDLHMVEICINTREERAGVAGGDEDGDGGSRRKKDKGPIPKDRRYMQLSLRSTGEESVDQFIDEAYAWYVREIKKSEDRDKSRYYYDLKDQDYSEGKDHEFKRYKLSDEKSFDSLFFPERDTIVHLLTHFLNKTGKYGIKGYPYKLGLLLHGPPGTGKTSLIKAIAQFTGRSIVNIPLARIGTNDELNRLFFSDEYHYDGSYYPKKMNFKDIVFVMEDIDAASKVVRRRDGKRTATVAQTAHVSLPVPKCMWRLLLESQADNCIQLVEKLVDVSERLKEDAMSSSTLTAFAQRMNSIPGLSVVGLPKPVEGSGHATIKKIASDALEDGQEMMEGSKSLDEYLDFHAKSILKLLTMGAVVDEAFENELLGLAPASASNEEEDGDDEAAVRMRKPASLSRDVSYNKYSEDTVEVETIDRTSHALSKLAAQHAMNSQVEGAESGTRAGPAGPGMPLFAGKGVGMGMLGGGGMGMMGGGGMGMGMEDPLDTFDDTPPKGGKWGKKGGWGGGGGGGFGGFGGFAGFGPVRDELNLSGLLNVLDGVVDTPGRILVMTTNHPEKLDPALIRPGRIDKKLILGYMHGEDVVQMLEHYFQLKLGGLQKERVRAAVRGDKTSGHPALSLTPAQIEQLTAEHDDIEDMIAALEEKGKPIVGKAPEQVSRITYD